MIFVFKISEYSLLSSSSKVKSAIGSNAFRSSLKTRVHFSLMSFSGSRVELFDCSVKHLLKKLSPLPIKLTKAGLKTASNFLFKDQALSCISVTLAESLSDC